jgi:hypothetical protein
MTIKIVAQKAERATVKLIHTDVLVFLMPDGEYRLSKTDVCNLSH